MWDSKAHLTVPSWLVSPVSSSPPSLWDSTLLPCPEQHCAFALAYFSLCLCSLGCALMLPWSCSFMVLPTLGAFSEACVLYWFAYMSMFLLDCALVRWLTLLMGSLNEGREDWMTMRFKHWLIGMECRLPEWMRWSYHVIHENPRFILSLLFY